jgi:hypothetical protein
MRMCHLRTYKPTFWMCYLRIWPDRFSTTTQLEFIGSTEKTQPALTPQGSLSIDCVLRGRRFGSSTSISGWRFDSLSQGREPPDLAFVRQCCREGYPPVSTGRQCRFGRLKITLDLIDGQIGV